MTRLPGQLVKGIVVDLPATHRTRLGEQTGKPVRRQALASQHRVQLDNTRATEVDKLLGEKVGQDPAAEANQRSAGPCQHRRDSGGELGRQIEPLNRVQQQRQVRISIRIGDLDRVQLEALIQQLPQHSAHLVLGANGQTQGQVGSVRGLQAGGQQTATGPYPALLLAIAGPGGFERRRARGGSARDGGWFGWLKKVPLHQLSG